MMVKKIKVLLQYLSLPEYRKSLFEELINEDTIEFSIVCGKTSPYKNLKNFIPSKNLNVTFIQNKFFTIGNYVFTWQKNIIKEVKKEKPDVLILLGMDPLILSNIFLFILAKIKGIKIIWWGHGTLGRQGIIGRKFRLFFYQFSNGVLLYNDLGKEILIKNKIKEEKLFVINNCINQHSYRTKINNRINREIGIVFSGRLEPRKRIDVIIYAIDILKKKNTPIRLGIIGDGEEKNSLENLVNSLNLSNVVKFYSAVYGKEADKIISKYNIGVIPGHAGLSIIHYMALGLPVITNNLVTEHAPEISAIKNGFNGYLFKPNDPTDLANKIIDLSKDLKYFSLNANRTADEKYSPKFVKKKFVTAIFDTFYHD